MHPFVLFLRQYFSESKELPGFEAQKKMAPIFSGGTYRSFAPPIESKQSAVLILLFQDEHSPDDVCVILTKRTETLSTHKGQISLPGGRMEHGESYQQTALRETEEEIGVAPHFVDVLGELSPLYTPPSNSTIHPVVGWSQYAPALTASVNEVQEIFTTSLAFLSDERNIRYEDWNYNNTPMRVPHWNVHPTTPLWGATAIILSELCALYTIWQR